MTNEEAIKLLNQEKIPMILYGKPNEHLAVAHIKAIEALEENTKLKVEIERLREYIENQKKLYEYRIDLQLEYSDRNHEEIERLKELMPKICETCEYEDEIGYEEPCNSCNNRKNWKLKSEE